MENYNIRQLSCLGITKFRFAVQVYDFIAHGVTSDYDGVIGLDFLRENKFCVDIAKGEIMVEV